MSDPRQPFVVAAVVVAMALGLGHAATQGADVRPPAASPVSGDIAISLGQPFVLAIGAIAFLDDGLEVAFVSVTEDSRCPTDVQCVWEGNAEIAIEVALAGESPTSLSLNTNTGFATEATYRSYTVALIDLEPYPSFGSKMIEPYRATLVVNSTGAGPSSAPSASPSPSASEGPSDS